MHKRITIILERPITGDPEAAPGGGALGRAVEAHPALEPLLDFADPDPREVAARLGMAYAYDPDDAADLSEIDFGPPEWHEPAAGLAAVRPALDALRSRPESVAQALYDPGLRPADVLADLEALERVLRRALDHETRFRLVLTE